MAVLLKVKLKEIILGDNHGFTRYKKSKKPRTKGYFERKADQKKAVQDYFKNGRNKKETTASAPGSMKGYKPSRHRLWVQICQVLKNLKEGKLIFKDVKVPL
jgi:hypothetical protein